MTPGIITSCRYAKDLPDNAGMGMSPSMISGRLIRYFRNEKTAGAGLIGKIESLVELRLCFLLLIDAT